MLLLCYLHLFYGVGYNAPDDKVILWGYFYRLVGAIILVSGHKAETVLAYLNALEGISPSIKQTALQLL